VGCTKTNAAPAKRRSFYSHRSPLLTMQSACATGLRTAVILYLAVTPFVLGMSTDLAGWAPWATSVGSLTGGNRTRAREGTAPIRHREGSVSVRTCGADLVGSAYMCRAIRTQHYVYGEGESGSESTQRCRLQLPTIVH